MDFIDKQDDAALSLIHISLCDKILESDIYKKYVASKTSSYVEDRELWRKLFKNIIFNNVELDQVLEDQSLYWNDDKEIVDTFVLKLSLIHISLF